MKATRCNPSARVSMTVFRDENKHLSSTHPADRTLHLVLSVLMFLFCFGSIAAGAQEGNHGRDYTSIVVFGDSLSDMGNVAHLTQAKYGVRIPGPAADYTDGRFTDGADTAPAAQKFFGVWIEQYAAMLPSKPKLKNSLDGGTNYAYGFATTGEGSSLFTFGPSNVLFIDVNNIGEQITTYLATHPRINDKTLFVVWGGAIDVLYAKSSNDVVDSAVHQVANIQRLIDAGATQFIVPNLPPLGLVPRLNGSISTSLPGTQASVLYNQFLHDGLAILSEFNLRRHIQLSQLDVFALFNEVVASPSRYSLVNVTGSSQGRAVNPDTYLFWDDLHPTTRGHRILASAAAKVIAQSHCKDDDDRDRVDSHSSCDGELENDSAPEPR